MLPLNLTTMGEYRSQLKRMGEVIAPSSHSATILCNLPESWCSIMQMIRRIAMTPEDIEEKLEAHKADLSAKEISTTSSNCFCCKDKWKLIPSF